MGPAVCDDRTASRLYSVDFSDAKIAHMFGLIGRFYYGIFLACLQTTLTTHFLKISLIHIEMTTRNVGIANRLCSAPLTFYGTLKLHSNGPLYSNTVIGTLAVDGWAVTFGKARRGLGKLWSRPVPSSLYQMKQLTHQRPVYQLHIIRCCTVLAIAL